MFLQSPLIETQNDSPLTCDTVDSEPVTCDSPALETKTNGEPEVKSSIVEKPTIENKKRKLDKTSSSENETPAKKLPVSSSSKLMAFMFKKS